MMKLSDTHSFKNKIVFDICCEVMGHFSLQQAILHQQLQV